MLDIEEALVFDEKKGKRKTKLQHPRRQAVIDVDAFDSEEEEEEGNDGDDNLDDFIVPDDVDDDDEYAPRSRKKKVKKPMVNKRKNVIVLDSDEEEEQTPEEKELIFGRKRKSLSEKEIKMLPRFFPSTKMKVGGFFCLDILEITIYYLVYDGEYRQACKGTS